MSPKLLVYLDYLLKNSTVPMKLNSTTKSGFRLKDDKQSETEAEQKGFWWER